MNNLHRELAPISSAAWADMEQEARRTFKRWIAGRRIVDVEGPDGLKLAAVGTGHFESSREQNGVQISKREAQHIMRLRVPFAVQRTEVDSVERGAEDADWGPVKDAIEKIALAEDHLVFYGSDESGIKGIIPASSNAKVALPADVREFPDAVSQALTELRLAGVNGPYALLLDADLYTAVSETTDHGEPIREHIAELVHGEVIWAPAIDGALLISTRGGDYTLYLGEDLSIGYQSHDDEKITLYVEESLTFRAFTAEASVAVKSRGELTA